MKFNSPLITVKDMKTSREFYEQIMSQKVLYDFGENVQFEGFSIHLKPHFAGLTYLPEETILEKANNAELYFEEDDLEGFMHKLKSYPIHYLHPLVEQPWGQRAVRFYDPDFHIIEVGETLQSVALRFLKKGLTAEETAKRISMPLEFVKSCEDEWKKASISDS